jgi:hypothetical protein
MSNQLSGLLRLARRSGNADPAPEKQLTQYLIDQLEQPSTPIGRLSPLLLDHLDKTPGADPELLRRLRFADGIVRQLHALQQQWLGEALTLLGKNGIRVLLLKAAAFNGDIYPPETPRIGSDLDILVLPGDYARARELLTTLFQPEPIPENEQATAEALWETSFALPQKLPCTLDLHRAIGSSLLFPVETEALFERSIPHPAWPQAFVRLPCPEDQLIHLATHSARDLSVMNHNLLDAHETWVNTDPDRQLLRQLAGASDARNALFLLLKTCKETLDTPVPESLLEELPASRFRASLAGRLFDRGLVYKRAEKSAAYKLRQALGYMLITDNVGNFRRYAANSLKLRKKDHTQH